MYRNGFVLQKNFCDALTVGRTTLPVIVAKVRSSATAGADARIAPFHETSKLPSSVSARAVVADDANGLVYRAADAHGRGEKAISMDTNNLTFGSPQVNLAPRSDDRANDPDLVHLAAAVYDQAQTKVGVWSRLDDGQLTAHGIAPERLDDRRSGLNAAIYSDSDRHALAFAGTEVTSVQDWSTNLRQGAGLSTGQYREAVTLARDAREAFGDSLILTGHSLGGGLASAAAAATQTTAVVFNPAGVHDRTYKREGVTPSEAKASANAGQVRNYVVAGEILDTVQTWLPIPKAVGQTVVLPDPAPMPPLLRVLPGAQLVHGAKLHGMAAVETAFSQYATQNPAHFKDATTMGTAESPQIGTPAAGNAFHQTILTAPAKDIGMETLSERRDDPGQFAQAVFKLKTRDGSDAYMCVSRSHARNDQRSVVEVDADRFVKLTWPERATDPAQRTPEAWKADYKYDRAEAGFREGAASPVPLPDVAAREDTVTKPVYARHLAILRKQVGEERSTQPSASFVDGTTRTMWLIANGVKRFPVECSNREEAQILQRHAGAEGSQVKSVDELLPERRQDRAPAHEVQSNTDRSPTPKVEDPAAIYHQRPDVASTLATARAFAAERLKPTDQARFIQRTAERLAADVSADRQPPSVEVRTRAIDRDAHELDR